MLCCFLFNQLSLFLQYTYYCCIHYNYNTITDLNVGGIKMSVQQKCHIRETPTLSVWADRSTNTMKSCLHGIFLHFWALCDFFLFINKQKKLGLFWHFWPWDHMISSRPLIGPPSHKKCDPPKKKFKPQIKIK